MLRSRRMFDICFRSLQGLPLPARALTTLLIESIIGRLIAAQQIMVCNYVWMANHVHMQVYSLDCRVLDYLQGKTAARQTHTLRIYPFKWLAYEAEVCRYPLATWVLHSPSAVAEQPPLAPVLYI
jgi:hypothetical protein